MPIEIFQHQITDKMMDYDGSSSIWLEPGPAAFYLPAEESTTGVEEEIFKFNISSVVLYNSGNLTSVENTSGKFD